MVFPIKTKQSLKNSHNKNRRHKKKEEKNPNKETGASKSLNLITTNSMRKIGSTQGY